MPKKVNLFIVGTRKTGTTALFHYLKDHPNIFMSPTKETHYFSQNLDYHIHLYNSLEDYLRLFKEVKNESIIGEASTSYLDNEDIPQIIAEYNPNAKIIIMLKDLVELIYTMHFEFAFRGRVKEDFREELEAQEKSTGSLNYLKIVKNLPPIIKIYQELFGKENVLILEYKEFSSNTPDIFAKILEFLEVDTSYRPEFKKYNASARPQSKFISKLLNSKIIQSIGKMVHRYIPGGNRIDPFFWNRKPFKRPAIPADLKDFLTEELKDTENQLQNLLKEPKSQAA